MKVVCAWCQKKLPDKAPLADTAVSHGICAGCEKAFTEELKKNPPEYEGTLKLPLYIERAVAFVLHDGPKALDLEWDERMSVGEKLHFANFLENIHHPLARKMVTPEQRFKRFVMEYVMPYIKKNPGVRYHGMKQAEADQQDRHAKTRAHKEFFHGKSVAHLESGLAARALKGNRVRARAKRNPLAVFTVGNPGRHRPTLARRRKNPPREIHAKVAGILYQRALGIEGQKLSVDAEKAGFERGKYYHKFSALSRVQILALDNGALLVQSANGTRLWG